ncbi:MAG: hypothetical protein K0U93_08955 [Gammaproteobacteria bacterium]|nr:hypothetical protein [Gammaproteobacteria bacterium]
MKRPSFLEGLGVALGASIAAGAVVAALGMVMPLYVAWTFVTAGLGFGYIAYLLSRAPSRTGRLTVAVVWAAMTGMLFVFGEPLIVHIAAQLGAIWLVRSLYFHSGVLEALADLMLLGLGFAAGLWAMQQSGSGFLSVWAFFLVQSLFTNLPMVRKTPARESSSPENSSEDFERAHRNAEAALKRLSAA